MSDTLWGKLLSKSQMIDDVSTQIFVMVCTFLVQRFSSSFLDFDDVYRLIQEIDRHSSNQGHPVNQWLHLNA